MFAQRFGGHGPQRLYLSLSERRNVSRVCLPLSSSFVCLAEITRTRRWCWSWLHCVKLLSAHHVHPSPPCPISPMSPFSLLCDWSFCYYFLAAGGDPGNLVNPLTTNCLLLPCCLDKQPSGGKFEPCCSIKVKLREEAASVTT